MGESRTIRDGLMLSERRLAGIFNHLPDATFVIDREGIVIAWNKAIEDMTGVKAERMLGKGDHEYALPFYGCRRPILIDSIFETDAALKDMYSFIKRDGDHTFAEVDLVMPGGRAVALWGKVSTLYNENGERIGAIESIRDITERRKAEAELSTLYRELEKRVTERTADLNTAQQELILKNDHLNVLNRQLTITREELQQKITILNTRELELQEVATSLKGALAEKDMLLSEIHHRVKNNLSAFISLLSLNGAYEETEDNKNLRKDLQNRARSMVLIHETLYRTQNFSTVDMEVYLTTLVGQIAESYERQNAIRTVVEASGVVLDFSRAATAGLIITELITNSFKYAFPPAFDCLAVRGEPCTIRVTLGSQGGVYTLSVADNGRGLPAGLDPGASKSLGLKLVHFLARHQLRAETRVIGDKGTEFVFLLDKIRGKP